MLNAVQDSVKFIRETLNSRDFDDFVTSNHLLVWGVSSHSEEGKHVAYTLHVLKFPFISLMCPRADNRMFSVRRIYGFLSANDLVEKFQKSIDSTKQDFRELREKRNKLLADRQIREEQEREYKESAERDRQKIMEARRSCQEKEKTEKIQRRRVLETEARRKVIATQRGQLRLQSPENAVSGETVSVQVRLPSGDNFVRRFSLDDNLEEPSSLQQGLPRNLQNDAGVALLAILNQPYDHKRLVQPAALESTNFKNEKVRIVFAPECDKVVDQLSPPNVRDCSRITWLSRCVGNGYRMTVTNDAKSLQRDDVSCPLPLSKLFDAIISHEKCPDFFTVASGFPRHPVHCAPEWYHALLSEQLAADGLTPPIYHPAHSFRDAGYRKAFAVFVNNCRT